MVTTNRLISRIGLSDQILDRKEVAVVAEWYRYQIVACLVNGLSPVPLKTRRKIPKVFIIFDKDVNINLYSEVNKSSRPIFFIADFKLRFSLSHL
ncbi:hypothetical protein TNCV_2479921 [Trichonephila clavipes]|nr:hypothetical protein TNCV_2479921 [Trichonephila clavipes]